MFGMKPDYNYGDAINSLHPGARFVIYDNDYNKLNWLSEDIAKPTRKALDDEIVRMTEAAPLNGVREIRDHMIKESDWTQLADVRAQKSPEWCAAWDEYRQKLRDLPNTATPYYNDMDLIDGVTWPQPPSL